MPEPELNPNPNMNETQTQEAVCTKGFIVEIEIGKRKIILASLEGYPRETKEEIIKMWTESAKLQGLELEIVDPETPEGKALWREYCDEKNLKPNRRIVIYGVVKKVFMAENGNRVAYVIYDAYSWYSAQETARLLKKDGWNVVMINTEVERDWATRLLEDP